MKKRLLYLMLLLGMLLPATISAQITIVDYFCLNNTLQWTNSGIVNGKNSYEANANQSGDKFQIQWNASQDRWELSRLYNYGSNHIFYYSYVNTPLNPPAYTNGNWQEDENYGCSGLSQFSGPFTDETYEAIWAILHTEPEPTTTCPTGSASFSADIEGATTYQWQKYVYPNYIDLQNNDHFSGVNTPTLVISNATNDMQVSYRLKAKNASSTILTKTVELTLTNFHAVMFIDEPVENASANNGKLSIQGFLGGTAPYTYLWSNGATTQSISGLGVGIYTCTVTDANGCTLNLSKSLQVTYAHKYASAAAGTHSHWPNFTLNNLSTCQSTVYLDANGYNWADNTFLKYAIEVNGQTILDNLYGKIMVDLTPYIPVTSVKLRATGWGFSQWLNLEGIVTVHSIKEQMLTGEPQVVNHTLCPIDGLPYTAQASLTQGGQQLLWYTDSNGSGRTTTPITITEAGNYTFYVSQLDINGCEGPRVAQNIRATNLSGEIIASNIRWEDNSTKATLTADVIGGLGSYTYSWNTGATTPSIEISGANTYTCTVNDNYGCSTVLQFNVFYKPQEYTLTGGGQICAGDTVGFPIGLSNSENGFSYQLKKGNSHVGNAVIGNNGPINFGTFNQSGDYTVMATTPENRTVTLLSKVAITNVNFVFNDTPAAIKCPGINKIINPNFTNESTAIIVPKFVGDYASQNWQMTKYKSNGTITYIGAPDTEGISIATGTEHNIPGSNLLVKNTHGYISIKTTVSVSGKISFGYSKSYNQSLDLIPEIIYNNQVYMISDFGTSSPTDDYGTVTMDVQAGMVLEIKAKTFNTFDTQYLYLYNFNFTSYISSNAEMLWTASNGGEIVGANNEYEVEVSKGGTYTISVSKDNCVFTKSFDVVEYEAEILPLAPLCTDGITALNAVIHNNYKYEKEDGLLSVFQYANWTTHLYNSSGRLEYDSYYNSLSFKNSYYSGSTTPTYTEFTVPIPADGTISFEWSKSMPYDFNENQFLIVQNGVESVIPGMDSPLYYDSGVATVNVTAGETFKIKFNSFNSHYSYFEVIFKNIVYTKKVVINPTLSWVATDGGVISGANNTNTIQITNPGTYTLTTTVDNCEFSQEYVLQSTAPLQSIIEQVQPVANLTANNGILKAVPSLGAAPYTYLWSNGATTQTISDLAIGTYSCTITDATGCQVTNSAELIYIPLQPTAFNVGGGGNTCPGGQGVNVTLDNSQIGVNYYLLSNNVPVDGQVIVGTGEPISFSNISIGGIYTIKATSELDQLTTDMNGQALILLTELDIQMATPVVNCDTNTVTLSVNTNTNLMDPSRWTFIQGNNDGNLLDGYLNIDPINSSFTIYGGNNQLSGNVINQIVMPSDGLIEFDFYYESDDSASNDYFSMSHSNFTVPINEFVIDVVNGVSRFGDYYVHAGDVINFGVFTVDGMGGRGSVTISNFRYITDTQSYTWSASNGGVITGPINGSSIIASTSGTYTATTTKNGCTFSKSKVVVVSDAIVTNPSFTNVTCNGDSNGTASVSENINYTYLWSNGATTATITNLDAGTYTVTVTNNNGCTAQEVITITQPDALIASAIVGTHVMCHGDATAEATASATGGTGTYSYLWSPSGQTTAVASGLEAGSHTVTITDQNGCVDSTTVVINEPVEELAVTATQIKAVSCYDGNDGEATAIATGGSGSYTFYWYPFSNINSVGGDVHARIPLSQNTDTATNFVAGDYTVLVVDSNGCSTTATVTITQPTVLAIESAEVINNNCTGNAVGSITPVIIGGTTPYTYSWSNQATTESLVGLSAGVYTVTVTDSNNCTVSATYTISEAESLQISNQTITPVTCLGVATGSVEFTVTGGSGIYTYAWTPNVSTSATANNLTAGNYQVIVRDNNGCSLTHDFVVTTNQPFIFSTQPLDAMIFVGQTAIFTASVPQAQSYQWQVSTDQTTWQNLVNGGSNPNYAGTNTATLAVSQLSNAHNGIQFRLIATSVEGCQITSNPAILFVDNVITANTDDFTAIPIREGQGGIAGNVLLNDTINNEAFSATNVIITITDIDGATGVTINNLGTVIVPSTTPQGNYAITYQICEVADPNNCSTATIMLEIDEPLSDKDFDSIKIDVYPNPATDKVFIKIPSTGSNNGSNVAVFDLNGRLVLQQSINSDIEVVDISRLANAVYVFKITSNNASRIVKVVKK